MKSYQWGVYCTAYAVAPRVGAWIEILEPFNIGLEIIVAPRVGAWIEIVNEDFRCYRDGRSPCGSVD